MDNNPDFSKLKEEILVLHKASINAHLNKDISFFVQDVSDEFIIVSRGDAQRPSTAETETRFTSYLGNTNFSEYRDLQEPTIGFSKDGSMAWSVAQVKVAGKQKNGRWIRSRLGFRLFMDDVVRTKRWQMDQDRECINLQTIKGQSSDIDSNY
jgi:hypothetical protein